MPADNGAAHGGKPRYRTIRVGQGKNRRYLRVAIVRKETPRGGRATAGRPHAYQQQEN